MERPALTAIAALAAEFLKAYAKGDDAAIARLRAAAARQTYAPAVALSRF